MATVENLRDRVALELGLQMMERFQKEIEIDHLRERLAELQAVQATPAALRDEEPITEESPVEEPPADAVGGALAWQARREHVA